MPISTTPLVTQINAGLADSSLSVLQHAQLGLAADTLMDNVVSVATISDLPVAAESTGRMIYVNSICDYRYSDGSTWTRDYTSSNNNDKLIWTWGFNSSGQLGDNTTVNKSSPVQVVGGFTDWSQFSIGYHTVGLRINGTLWAWGYNGGGQLGDNSIANKSSPVSVVGGFTDWCQVSAGFIHTAAIRTNGTIWSWGLNSSGRLGDNTAVNKSSPVSVVGGFSDWCQVSAGNNHTAAVRTNGTLWTWGSNFYGQLGDNTTVDKSSPGSVVGGFSDWCQVSAGNNHTAAVRTNGTLWTWGRNTSGQLGDNTTVNKSSPVSVVGGFTNWCQVSAGGNCHTAAIRTNGTLWTWGSNGNGRLGDNTTVNKSSPVQVVGGFTDWCQVGVGWYNSAAIRTNGTLWTWGNNASGRLGDNTVVDKSSPVSVVGGFTDWCNVGSARSQTAAIRVKYNRGF